MPIHIVRLGQPRARGEGLRIGTVRRPPRGVPKERYAADDWYDVWLPELSPPQEVISAFRNDPSPAAWRMLTRAYRAEMSRPPASHLLDLLTALSKTASLAVGCYCEDEQTCHRSVLRELFEERGAEVI